ncbi:allergen V5/Tpx-1 family protein [Calothrix sp. NIES-4071]|nr:allergen V5/Tpx-1 family protein [Calothrix sp. NIES-4071]BAZ63246.1 allergen V5/Tpx-1 family protein [Calothrix sp. NIES-4105]
MNRHVTIGAILLAGGLFSSPDSTSANTRHYQQAPQVIQVAQSTTVKTDTLEQSIFEKINQYRTSKGLSRLARNTKIDDHARSHSQDMANGKTPFGHQDFSNRVKSIGIAYSGAAENVAYNQGYKDPATQAVQGWLKSRGHKKNIEGNYSQTGIGVAANSKGEIYFTEIFINSK